MRSESPQYALRKSRSRKPDTAEGREFWLRQRSVLLVLALLSIVFSWFVVLAVVGSGYHGESLASLETISGRVLRTLVVVGIIPIFVLAVHVVKLKLPTFIKMLFAADVALALAYVSNMIMGEPSWFFSRMVNLGYEANLPTWYSSAKLFMIALLLAVFAYYESERNERAPWLPVAAAMVFFLLSLDEFAQIHEWLGGRLDMLVWPGGGRRTSLFPRTGVWMFALGPLLVGVLLWLGMRARHYFVGRERIMRKYVVGMVIFVGSAAGIEILSNFVWTNHVATIVQIVCEELGEMLGATILLWATWDLLVSYDFTMSMEVRR